MIAGHDWKILPISNKIIKYVKYNNSNISSSDELYNKGKKSIALMNSNSYPSYNKKHSNIPTIINLDNKDNGTHWTGIKPSKKINNVMLYQDSFGVPPPFKLNNKLIVYNPYIKQKYYKQNCGQKAFNFIKK